MDESNKKTSSRRGFITSGLIIGVVGLTAAAGVCLCSLGACKKKKANTPIISPKWFQVFKGRISVDVDHVEALTRVGGAAKIKHPSLENQILVIRVTQRGFVAVTNRCTHKGGEIVYNAEKKRLVCSNYGHSVFHPGGRVIKGPASRALKTYRLLIIEGKLEIFT
jgi:Rieske Fe-S protein